MTRLSSDDRLIHATRWRFLHTCDLLPETNAMNLLLKESPDELRELQKIATQFNKNLVRLVEMAIAKQEREHNDSP